MSHKAWNVRGEMPYCFPRSSIKFQGHPVQNITDFDPYWVFPDYRPVAAFKSLRFALFKVIHQISRSHRLKNRWIGSNLSKITRPVAAIKSLRFALLVEISWIIYQHLCLKGTFTLWLAWIPFTYCTTEGHSAGDRWWHMTWTFHSQ